MADQIVSDAKKGMNAILKKYNLTSEFTKVLKSTKSIIVGDCVLKAVQDRKFTPSTMSIHTDKKNNKKLEQIFESLGYHYFGFGFDMIHASGNAIGIYNGQYHKDLTLQDCYYDGKHVKLGELFTPSVEILPIEPGDSKAHRMKLRNVLGTANLYLDRGYAFHHESYERVFRDLVDAEGQVTKEDSVVTEKFLEKCANYINKLRRRVVDKSLQQLPKEIAGMVAGYADDGDVKHQPSFRFAGFGDPPPQEMSRSTRKPFVKILFNQTYRNSNERPTSPVQNSKTQKLKTPKTSKWNDFED